MTKRINGSEFETMSDDSIERMLNGKKVTVEFKENGENLPRELDGQITGFFGYQHDEFKINSIAGFTLKTGPVDIAFSENVTICIHD